MQRTVSIRCPRCGYVRYDLIHINNSCGGLLVRDDSNEVYCKLCHEEMNYCSVTCPNCGFEREVNLQGQFLRIIKLEVYETIIL